MSRGQKDVGRPNETHSLNYKKRALGFVGVVVGEVSFLGLGDSLVGEVWERDSPLLRKFLLFCPQMVYSDALVKVHNACDESLKHVYVPERRTCHSIG